mgnify:CR=1 FL=1
MLVRVKKGLGNYGHVPEGYVQPKNYASGAFEVTEEKGRELVARGIVDVVEGCICTPAPAAIEEPAPKTAEPKAKKAPKKTAKTAKKGAKKVEETAENVPTFDAMGGIE